MTSEAFRTDPMFLRNQFKTDGTFDIPIIQKQKIDLTQASLVGYDQTVPYDKANRQSFVHFFMDDYKFEVIWKDPEPRLQKLSQYRGVLSPQFSTYYTMPQAAQLYNTFRSRWCGAYLQSKGLTVIPTVSWGLPQSYWYCFDGIEKGSVVAVSTLGVKKEKDFFLQGYRELLRRVEPQAILCYSSPFEEMEGNLIPIDYAQTNHLAPHSKIWTFSQDSPNPSPPGTFSSYVQKTSGYIILTGMGRGSASGGRRTNDTADDTVRLPPNDAQIKHIFADRPGHLSDTPQNRALLLKLAGDTTKFRGTDMYGNRWHIETRPDGTQLWVRHRNNVINEGGLNTTPKAWDAETGLNNNPSTTKRMCFYESI